MRSARLAPLVAVAALAAGCVGSSSATADLDVVDATIATDVPATDVAATNEPGTDVPATDEAGDGAESATTGPEADPSEREPVTTDAAPVATTSDGDAPPPTTDRDPDGAADRDDDEFDGAFAPENVDDSDYCRAYADFFSTFLALLLDAGFFDAADASATDAAVSVEVVEVALAPSLVAPVGTMIAEGPPEAAVVFAGVVARLDEAISALRDAGFDDGEIEALASGDGVPESAGDAGPRFVEAARLLVERDGTFADHSSGLDAEVDPAAAEANDRAFVAACPRLDAAFD